MAGTDRLSASLSDRELERSPEGCRSYYCQHFEPAPKIGSNGLTRITGDDANDSALPDFLPKKLDHSEPSVPMDEGAQTSASAVPTVEDQFRVLWNDEKPSFEGVTKLLIATTN